MPRTARILGFGLALPAAALGLAACSAKSTPPGPQTAPAASSSSTSTTTPPSSSTSSSSSYAAATSTTAPAASTATTKGTATSKADTIVIQNYAFNPKTLRVAPGTKVTVFNKDQVTHTATDQGVFDTSLIPGGTSKTFTAPTKPGTYNYICTVHAFMHGVLIVQ